MITEMRAGVADTCRVMNVCIALTALAGLKTKTADTSDNEDGWLPMKAWRDHMQAHTSILNNEAAFGDRLCGLDAPAPVPGQKHLHPWRLQLMKRPVHNTVKTVSYTMPRHVHPKSKHATRLFASC